MSQGKSTLQLRSGSVSHGEQHHSNPSTTYGPNVNGQRLCEDVDGDGKVDFAATLALHAEHAQHLTQQRVGVRADVLSIKYNVRKHRQPNQTRIRHTR